MIEEVMKYLVPHSIVGYEKTRVGPDVDGGYVMVNDFKDIRVAISGGIGHDDLWETHMYKSGIKVEGFDVNSPSDPRTGFNYYVTKMEGFEFCDNSTLDMVLSGYGNNEAIAKIDIEGDEWKLLKHTSSNTLNKIRHMVLEFHFLGDVGNVFSKGLPVFSKLYRNFRVIHVHGNNWGDCYQFNGKNIPDVVEISFANINYYDLFPSGETFPNHLDKPNNPSRDDIQLGTFTF